MTNIENVPSGMPCWVNLLEWILNYLVKFWKSHNEVFRIYIVKFWLTSSISEMVDIYMGKTSIKAPFSTLKKIYKKSWLKSKKLSFITQRDPHRAQSWKSDASGLESLFNCFLIVWPHLIYIIFLSWVSSSVKLEIIIMPISGLSWGHLY